MLSQALNIDNLKAETDEWIKTILSRLSCLEDMPERIEEVFIDIDNNYDEIERIKHDISIIREEIAVLRLTMLLFLKNEVRK